MTRLWKLRQLRCVSYGGWFGRSVTSVDSNF